VSTVPDDRVQRAAEAIADGRDPELSATPADSDATLDLFAGLRALAGVARVHRAALGAAPEPSAAPATEPPARFAWGPLRAIEPLGAGAFGEVWRAHDPALGRDVALKLRAADEPAEGPAARRWLDEARRLARVRHPNVVHVYGAATHGGRAGIWMELVRGATLERWLETHGPMGWREAAGVGLELCAALAAVHGAGLVHNDLKPANVMREGGAGRAGGVEGTGRIVLMDFGAGQALDARGAGTGGAFGTPLSTAPEVLAGEPPTPASDLWSLGALLYRLVAGRAPVEARTAAELVAGAGRFRPLREARPDLPRAFVEAVERALAPNPRGRFAGAAEMERALAQVRDGVAPGTGVPRRPRGLLPVLAGAGALAMLALVLLPRPVRTPAPPAPAAVGDARSPEAARESASGGSAPPPAAPAATAPSVRARLVRATAGGVEPVEDGDLVAPGDLLALEIETEEPLWIYALDEDRTGAIAALFPVAGLDLANPLPPGRHRLPGARRGRALDWQVTSSGGRETFLFVAARAAVPAVETRVAAVAAAREGEAVAYAPLEAGDLAGFRGVAGLAPSRTEASLAREGRLAALARSLAARRDAPVWVRRVVVENP
jgi:hypothetical protein